MINVSDATKEAFLTSSTQKTIYIEFPNKNIVLSNDDIVSESFELKQTLESEPNLFFMGCNASQVKFQAAEIVEDLRGELMTVSIQAGNTETIKLFTGYVESQSNLTQEDFITDIVAYDAFYKMSKLTMSKADFNNLDRLRVPFGLSEILKFLDDNYGLLWFNENQDYYNDSIDSIKYDYLWNLLAFVDGVKIIDVIRTMCQMCAAYGYIDRNGLLAFKRLQPLNRATYPGINTFPANDLYPAGENADIMFSQSDYISARYEPFDTQEINSYTQYWQNQKKFYPNSQYIARNLEIGNSAVMFRNWFHISENELLQRLNKIWYKPSEIEVVGRPWVEIGDSYLFTTRKNIVRSYVLKRTLKGIQSLFDTYEAEGEEPQDVNDQNDGAAIDARTVSIGNDDSSPGALIINGHTVTFKNITISGTTYHLLGYTD